MRGIIIAMMLIVFLLGMVLDPVGIMLITLPVFLPIVDALRLTNAVDNTAFDAQRRTGGGGGLG